MELKFYRVDFLVKGVFPQVETIDIFQRRVGPWDFLNSKELKSFCYNVKLKYQAKLKDAYLGIGVKQETLVNLFE